MTSQLAVHHPADCMNEVLTVQIFESVLVRVVSVGPMVKLVS